MKTKFIADNGISKEKRETFEVNGLTSPDVIKILSKDHISLLNLNIGDSLRLDIAIKKMNEEKGDQTPNYLQKSSASTVYEMLRIQIESQRYTRTFIRVLPKYSILRLPIGTS